VRDGNIPSYANPAWGLHKSKPKKRILKMNKKHQATFPDYEDADSHRVQYMASAMYHIGCRQIKVHADENDNEATIFYEASDEMNEKVKEVARKLGLGWSIDGEYFC
jgi:hypothetical protein